jgi:S1-C subfamily serine protease
MDIEELSKTQIILLVLLVTFVTSIATGIVTVALLAQAPPAVTQTVNHIIQRTVEAVAPAVTTAQPTTVKETTVVVKEDDLVTDSITNSFAKVGAIHATTATTSPTVALGIVISGTILLTDSSSVSDDEHVVVYDATSTIYTVKKRFTDVGVAVMSPKNSLSLPGFKISDADSVKLGQSVIALPSAFKTRVGIGSVTARYPIAHIVSGTDDTAIRAIETNISGTITAGAPLVTVSGDVIGIATGISQGDAGSSSTFISLSDLAPIFLGVRGTSTPETVTTAQ